jgi:hypothetical protein
MEATGVYWKPVWHILDGHFVIILANAMHVRRCQVAKATLMTPLGSPTYSARPTIPSDGVVVPPSRAEAERGGRRASPGGKGWQVRRAVPSSLSDRAYRSPVVNCSDYAAGFPVGRLLRNPNAPSIPHNISADGTAEFGEVATGLGSRCFFKAIDYVRISGASPQYSRSGGNGRREGAAVNPPLLLRRFD